MNKILLRVLIIVAIVVLVLIGSLCALQIYREINVKKSSKNVFAVPTIKVSETVDSISFKKEHSNEDKLDKSVVTWKSTEFGFRCMANMIYKGIFEDNVPTTFYVYVNATAAELDGKQAKDAWICTKTKAQDIPFNNSGTGLTGTTINQVITEINTTLTERTILDWKDDPTTVDVGGIKAGFQTPADGINVGDFLYQMTHPFVYPNLSLTLTPPAGVYEKNTTLTFSKVVVNSTKGTKPAFEKEEPKIYVNNSEVTTTDTTSVTTDKMTYVREFAAPKTIPGTSDVTVKAEVKVNDKTLKTETAYKFVYPMYIGSIEAAIVSSFQNDLFISNNKLVVVKSNQITTIIMIIS